MRISLWVRGHGRVLRARSGRWGETGAAVDIADCTLTSSRAVGGVGDVRWNLACATDPWRLEPAPLPAKALKPFDLQLSARPRARFTGTVEVAGQTFRLDDAAGSLVHYWGRRLPDSWLWVSADGVGEDDVVVEAALFRSRLWGLPGPVVAAGYFAVDARSRPVQIIAPVYGRVTARGTETTFEVRARSWGREIHLVASAPRTSYNDLGEGIHQTLLGDVTVDGWGSCSGRAGLEVRGDIIATAWLPGR